MAEDSGTAAPIGYMVVAKRPDQREGFRYESVGSIWPIIGPCENHQAWCEMTAADKPEKYGDVEYIIAEIRPTASEHTP